MSQKVYRVVWSIDLNADSPEEAARMCQKWMDKGDTGWQFDVTEMDKAIRNNIGETVKINHKRSR